MENLAQGLKRIKPVSDLLGSIDLSLTETELIRPVRVMNKEQETAIYAAHNDGATRLSCPLNESLDKEAG